MTRLRRQLLRAFILTHDQQSEKDRCFVATLETPIKLVMACGRKKTSSKDVRGINGQRLRGSCRYCGATAELMAFTDEGHQRNSKDKLHLSNLYCTTYRPKTHDGSHRTDKQKDP